MSKIARAALDLRSLATGRISGTDPMIHLFISSAAPVGSPTQNGFRRDCAAAVSADIFLKE